MVNHLGEYGTPAMIYIHDEPRVKYPTEVVAAAHIYNPLAACFVPAPIGPLKLWCPGCQAMKLADLFSPCPDRPTLHRGYCKACEKAKRKERRAKKHRAFGGQWYRSA